MESLPLLLGLSYLDPGETYTLGLPLNTAQVNGLFSVAVTGA